MGKIIRWYNQNRRIIWQTIISIAVVIGLIQLLNFYYKMRSNDKSSSTNNSTTTSNNKDIYTPVIGGEELKEENREDIVNPIESFLEFCNQGNIEQAYSMLSNDCIEKNFPTVEEFKEEYIEVLFSTKKTYSIQSWINNEKYHIYRIAIQEDYLSSGNAYGEEMEEYCTVVKENDEYKINVKSYIGTQEINKENKTNELEILVKNKEIYMDYEIYNMQIKNYSQNEIKLDSRETGDKVYGIDNNEVKYLAFIYEKVDSDLIVRPGETKEINIRIKKNYNLNNQINQLIFSDIILNNEEYKQVQDKKLYKNRTEIKVDI